MVVCNTSILPIAQASCPVTPTALHAFPPGLCPMSPISALQCNQRYTTNNMLTAGQALTSTYSQGAMTSVRQGSPNTPESDNSVITCNVVTSHNGVLTSSIVPCTTSIPSLVPFSNSLSTIVPYSQGLSTATLLQCNPNKVQCNSSTSISSVLPCNPGIYTCNAMVPCTQRVVNGAPVLPGVCQVQPATVLQGTVEMCPITPPPSVNQGFPLPVSPSLIPQNLCSATAAPSWRQSYGMEQVWQCEFKTLFCQYSPHMWLLLPVLTKPMGLWNANVDSAKVRFCCEDCGHGWTSMKGRVAFWFVLNPTSGEGVVCLKLYGQQCDRCKTGNYEPAMWYPEEVIKVLVNIYNRVGQVYYGFQQAPYHKARRPGKPRTPHNSELCQACKDGVCSERR